MPTSFPAGLDNFTNPNGASLQIEGPRTHSQQHADLNDAVEALQRKVGADRSQDVTSLDNRLAVLEGSPPQPGLDSARVVDTQPVTGAVLRTQRSKNGDVLSVKDFGANGDGTTDDTAAFTSAAATGLEVAVPSGTYALTADVSGRWRIGRAVTFSGAGKATHVIRGFFTEATGGVDVYRLRDRVFVGDGTLSSGRDTASASESWLLTQHNAYYFERGAQFLSLSSAGKYGGVFATRASDQASIGKSGETSIGIAGVALNDRAGAGSSWAGYFEATRSSGSTGYTQGLEVSVRNLGNDQLVTPYGLPAGSTIGIQMAGGSDATYGGGSPTPVSVGIHFARVGNTWNRGIVFRSDALTAGVTPGATGTAMSMAVGHAIEWRASDGLTHAVRCDISTTTNAVQLQYFDGNFGWVKNNKYLLRVDSTASAVNYHNITPTATGTSPLIAAAGDDTDIGLRLRTKGTGAGLLQDSGSVDRIKWNTTGVAFNGAAIVGKQSVGSASTDLATVITLANNLRTAFINYGLCQT